MNQEQLMEFLVSTYEKVTGPLPVVGSAMDLAESYRKPGKDIHNCVDSLIRWQCTKTATSGFVSGLGGIITLPVTIPADLAQSLYVQLRMVAAIGHLYDYDIHSEKVRTLCFASLCGGSAAEILTNTGIKFGQKLAHNLIKSISRETIVAINKKVGFRLLTKFGTTGIINLGKCIPLFGGGVGAAMNLAYTYSVGKAAKAIMGGEELAEESPVAVTVVSTSSSPQADLTTGYGPKIHGLRLGLEREDIDELINNLSKKHRSNVEHQETGTTITSTHTKELLLEIEYDEEGKITCFTIAPRIFNVKEFFSPKFLHEFKNFYNLHELPQTEENNETLTITSEDENYKVAINNDKMVIKQLYEDNPYFA